MWKNFFERAAISYDFSIIKYIEIEGKIADRSRNKNNSYWKPVKIRRRGRKNYAKNSKVSPIDLEINWTYDKSI